jgi:hypothetical protein
MIITFGTVRVHQMHITCDAATTGRVRAMKGRCTREAGLSAAPDRVLCCVDKFAICAIVSRLCSVSGV